MRDIPILRHILDTNRAIAANPSYREMLGQRCYPALREIPEQVDIVDILRDIDQALAAAQQAR